MAGQASAGSRGGALVTGAARRIGRGIATALARAGYDVALHASPASFAEAEAAAAELRRETGRRAVALAGDLAEPATADRLVAEAAAALGDLAILVNSASVFEPDEATDPTELARHLAVNLAAPLRLAAAFARRPGADGGDRAIVHILDQRVLRPLPGFHSYAVSKAALAEATRTGALAFARLGIRVNAVAPGPVLPNRFEGEDGFRREARGVPLGRAVTVDEVAAAVLYFATARSVTGQILAVDGGQHLSPPPEPGP